MNRLELNTTRRRLLLTQQDLADRLEISRGTVGRWEREDAPIPRWAALAVRYLATDRVPQPGDWDFIGSLPEPQARGVDIGVRDIEGDERYTEEEQMKIYSRIDNVRTVAHRKPRR